MRIATILLVLGLLGPGSALAATRAEHGETIDATSLLTAERRARDAADRLRLPSAAPARWKAGGHGWMPAWTREQTTPRKPPSD
jgi:hypothetical protein